MTLGDLEDFIQSYAARQPNVTKEELADAVQAKFSLGKERKLFVGPAFSVRFCRTSNENIFAGGVLSIAAIVEHDDKPLIVCLLTPTGSRLMLANTSFVNKVSHSSTLLTTAHLRGTILGDNIVGQLNGIPNTPANFASLWALHAASDKAANLARIVAATQGIVGSAQPWSTTPNGVSVVLRAPELAAQLTGSTGYVAIKTRLDTIVRTKSLEILEAARIANGKDRGELIEKLITNGTGRHGVGDFECQVGTVAVLVDVKSKVADKNAAPKAWNVDKVLTELARGSRVLSMYFIRIDLTSCTTETRLVSIFDSILVAASGVQHHWSGVGTRGAIQFSGAVDQIWQANFTEHVDVPTAVAFLQKLIDLTPNGER